MSSSMRATTSSGTPRLVRRLCAWSMQRVAAKFAWKPPSLIFEGLVEEGAVVPGGDPQDVGIVRGRSDFVDVGQRVHETTQVVQLTLRARSIAV